jgi:hypothetical protein
MFSSSLSAMRMLECMLEGMTVCDLEKCMSNDGGTKLGEAGKEPKYIDFRHTPQLAGASVTQIHHGCVEGAGFGAFMNKDANLVRAEQNPGIVVLRNPVAVVVCQKRRQSHRFSAVKIAERGQFPKFIMTP